MIKATVYLLENNKWVDKTKEFQHPIEQSKTLDETLDTGFLYGNPTERKEIYERDMPVKIVFRDVDESN